MLDMIKKAGISLARPVMRVSSAATTSGVSELFGAIASSGINTVIAEANDQIQKKFWDSEKSRRTAMAEFRAKLEKFTSPDDDKQNNTNIIFVIDELDRCRPDYALELLEVIKHFFSAPHLHFVLGVNLKALEDIIRIRYGDTIDAPIYLRKFIQITLELPDEIDVDQNRKKTCLVYLNHLVKKMDIKSSISK